VIVFSGLDASFSLNFSTSKGFLMFFRSLFNFVFAALILFLVWGAGAGQVNAQPASDLLPVPSPAPIQNGGSTTEGQPAVVSEAPADDALLKKNEADAAVAAGAVPQEVVEIPPTQDVLTPVPVGAAAEGAVVNGAVPDQVTGEMEVPVVPAIPPAKIDENTLFFDSESLVPEGEMKTGVPREVNPSVEPGSKLIVVTKDSGANSMQARLVSAQRAMILGRYDSALRIFEEMYAKNKKDPNVLLGRAIAMQKIGNTDSAIQAYQELLDVKPGNVDAELNMLGLMGKQYPAVALQRLMSLRDKNPDNPGVLAQIAVAQGRLGQYPEAMQSLGMAAAIDKNNASHLFNMAVIADRMGDKSKAIQYYQDALETDTIYGGGESIPREAVYERLAQIR
jgi:Flp pilus assembly protein TadD